MRKSRSFRLAVALAFLVNVLGSPMAWAHLFGADLHGSGAASTEMAAPCHGEGAHTAGAIPDGSSPGTLPCCDGGGCTCAAPAFIVFFDSPPARIPHPAFSAPADTSTLPAHPFDDTLRPPIG